jgi:8-oxo-dGTP diphosphatase
VWGVALDPRNFSRKVLSTTGLVEATGGQRRQDLGRPAALYRRGTARYVYPPILGQAAADD